MSFKKTRLAAIQTAGFTLIELLIVVVILSTLASLVVPQLLNQTDESKAIVATATVKNVQKNIRSYYILNGHWPTEIDRAWFSDKKYPRNPYYPDFEGPTANIENINNKWHPTYKTFKSLPPFWYNASNGSLRIRVPGQATDTQTIDLYNKINNSLVANLYDVVSL